MEHQKQALEKQGFEVESRIVPGMAKREINRIAEEEDYSLIVVGSHGHSLLGEVFLGGVTNEVIHHAVKPVLVIALEKHPDAGAECLRASRCDFAGHILFPTDFSENADNAFGTLEEMAASGARHITRMHVQDRTRIEPHLSHRIEEFDKIDRDRLEKLKKILNKAGNAKVDIELTYGSPFEEIMRIIRERDINQVVMGSQGRGFVEEIFLGSVSHNVVRHAKVSVLLIPAKRHKKQPDDYLRLAFKK